MHEQILIFYNKLKTYNEQLTFNHKPYKITRQITKQQGFGKQKMHFKSNSGFRHAKSILNIPNPRTKNGHPTEKPVKLLEYLIKTYTNKNDVILDPFMGCGSTGIACKNLDRKFIGIEKELNYYKSAAIKINGVNVE
jgi:site-specific DNA-methyltransferase (adenine-specific)